VFFKQRRSCLEDYDILPKGAIFRLVVLFDFCFIIITKLNESSFPPCLLLNKGVGNDSNVSGKKERMSRRIRAE